VLGQNNHRFKGTSAPWELQAGDVCCELQAAAFQTLRTNRALRSVNSLGHAEKLNVLMA